ncbi:MAG: hypothetical protein IJX34_02480 [Clostridia bacterium]|nr:hypothetical protein [Clostridia bacterium]
MLVHQAIYLNLFIKQLFFGIVDLTTAEKLKQKAAANMDKKMRELRISQII